MTETAHKTGRLKSGDVTLFYRLFGAPGKTPIMILHGANYFDSTDWIEVAAALATDREVVAFDRRGFGESEWSPSKDYSADALMEDMQALAAHLGWSRFIPMGHSMAGGPAICFTANFPEMAEKLIIVDSNMKGEGGGGPSVGNPPTVFDSVDAAMERFAKLNNPPRFAKDRARAEAGLKKIGDGYLLKRDPDFRNGEPQGQGLRKPVLESQTRDEQLKRITRPVLLVRGSRSDRYPPEEVERVAAEYPHIQWAVVDSQHDVAYQDPAGLLKAVCAFID